VKLATAQGGSMEYKVKPCHIDRSVRDYAERRNLPRTGVGSRQARDFSTAHPAGAALEMTSFPEDDCRTSHASAGLPAAGRTHLDVVDTGSFR
jgi:hypothetical protein